MQYSVSSPSAVTMSVTSPLNQPSGKSCGGQGRGQRLVRPQPGADGGAARCAHQARQHSRHPRQRPAPASGPALAHLAQGPAYQAIWYRRHLAHARDLGIAVGQRLHDDVPRFFVLQFERSLAHAGRHPGTALALLHAEAEWAGGRKRQSGRAAAVQQPCKKANIELQRRCATSPAAKAHHKQRPPLQLQCRGLRRSHCRDVSLLRVPALAAAAAAQLQGGC